MAAIEVRGLMEFRRALKAAGDQYPKAMTQSNKAVSTKFRDWARGEAEGLGGLQAKEAGAITAYATQTAARAGFQVGSKRWPAAAAAFWGAKRHSGWYAGFTSRGKTTERTNWQGTKPYDKRRAGANSKGPANLPPWVGNGWDYGVAGSGPYALNSALAHHLDEIVDMYRDGLFALMADAFPDS